jgi:hypothetical protein
LLRAPSPLSFAIERWKLKMFFEVLIKKCCLQFTGNQRPISAGRDWQLYGDEYSRLMFGNVSTDG